MNDIVAVGKRKLRSENQRLSEERMTLAEMVMSMQPLSRTSHTWKETSPLCFGNKGGWGGTRGEMQRVFYRLTIGRTLGPLLFTHSDAVKFQNMCRNAIGW